jgi:hypothetical protein
MNDPNLAPPHAKRAKNRALAAFTKAELNVLLFLISICALVTLESFQNTSRTRTVSKFSRCVNNLKQIGVAYRVLFPLPGVFPCECIFSDQQAGPVRVTLLPRPFAGENP